MNLAKPKPTKAQKRHKLAVKIGWIALRAFYDYTPHQINRLKEYSPKAYDRTVQAIEKILKREGM